MDNRSEHVVFFPGADGGPAFRRLPSLDEAVRFVEHLRNVEGVSDVSAYGLAEVPLSFRPYYRVEVGAAAPVETMPAVVEEPAPVEPVEQVADSVQDEVVEEMVPAAREEHAPTGRRGLAFFAS